MIHTNTHICGSASRSLSMPGLRSTQCCPGNFPLSQKLLDLEGFGTLPPELLFLSGHWSVPNTLTSPSTCPACSTDALSGKASHCLISNYSSVHCPSTHPNYKILQEHKYEQNWSYSLAAFIILTTHISPRWASTHSVEAATSVLTLLIGDYPQNIVRTVSYHRKAAKIIGTMHIDWIEYK